VSVATALWTLKNRPAGSVLFGLCAFEAQLGAIGDDLDGEAHISFGGCTATLPLKSVVAPKSSEGVTALFHVHTHLVSNGIASLKVQIRWFRGETLEWPNQEFEVDNFGRLAQEVSRDLKAYSTPAISGHVIDSTLYPYGAGRSQPWFEEGNGQDIQMSTAPAATAEDARRHLMRWGFCILKASIPSDLIESFNSEIDGAFETGLLKHQPGSSERVQGAHKLPSGKKIWLYPAVLKFLRDWFQDDPCACQSLLFINGSEQQPHQDTIHLTPYPFGYMCGVWIPLEDVREGAGELVVYPGSHRSVRLTTERLHLDKVHDDYSSYVAFDNEIAKILADGGYQRLVYRPRAGQILVWHENLIHGDSKRQKSDLTRRSFVSHYFAKGSVAYYDSRGDAAGLEMI
jgi:hypothetical protein